MPGAPSTPTTALRVTLHGAGGDVLELPLATDSPWADVLGAFPLPAPGALEALAQAIGALTEPPARVTLHAPPASALLALLCVRTSDAAPPAVTLAWSPVEPPYSADPREVEAARLACRLADSLECASPDAARALWSIDPARLGAAPALSTFDDALALIDGWADTPPGEPSGATEPADWNAAVRAALASCAERGLTRVALYGAGTHTRALGEALRRPPVEIVAIIDDHPPTPPVPGTTPRLWGYPILPAREALGLALDAVVLSANSMEDRLWAAAAPFRERGIEVVRLYTR